MRLSSAYNALAAVLVILILSGAVPLSADAAAVIGPRTGYNFDSDNFSLGAEAEVGQAFQSFRFAPSLDFELGDNTTTAFNADFRLYLFHLPETGLRFYGSAGPTFVLDSPSGGDSQLEVGLSLVAGVKIPMKDQRRYNVEARFGFGDIPGFKMMLAVLFGI